MVRAVKPSYNIGLWAGDLSRACENFQFKPDTDILYSFDISDAITSMQSLYSVSSTLQLCFGTVAVNDRVPLFVRHGQISTIFVMCYFFLCYYNKN